MIKLKIMTAVGYTLLFSVFLLALVGCNKERIYPELEDMEEFRRSLSHGGMEVIPSDFEESVIKSALIVKARLDHVITTEENYVIYEFQVLESIKNDFGDEVVQVYEPKLSDAQLLYEPDQEYLLILSRSTDIYYTQPVTYNFSDCKIAIGSSGKLTEGTIGNGTVDLKETYDIKTYKQLLEVIKAIRTNNTTIKEGSYNFAGREILDVTIEAINSQSTYVQIVTIKEVLYENRLLSEVMCQVEDSIKGEVEDYIIISIPKLLSFELEEGYLVTLFKDGNYTLSSLKGLVPITEKATVEAYKKANPFELIPEITPETEKEIQEIVSLEIDPFYQGYLSLNSDVKGWFKIEDTIINYPVLQGPDNEYYLDYNIHHEQVAEGSIILDYRMDITHMEHQTLVYGHNMKAGTMFHEIVNYKNKNFYDDHPIIQFDTLYEDIQWEVFSVHVIDTNYLYIMEYPLSDPLEYQAYLDDIIERSMFFSDVEVTIEDDILTLITCSYEFEGARTILHAKRIK